MKFIEKEMKKWKSLEEITKELVKKNIKWKRKGMTYTNNYEHSFNVYDLLVKDWYDEDICIAWLLHDIIEDWWHTEQQLLDLWYNARVVSLVVACSHNPSIEDSYKRRENIFKSKYYFYNKTISSADFGNLLGLQCGQLSFIHWYITALYPSFLAKSLL